MASVFSSPKLLDADLVVRGLWPCDENDCPLRFHPAVIYKKLPPDLKVLTTKGSLATAFIEFARSLHLLFVHERRESLGDAQALRQYLELIFNNYGEEKMRWVINTALIGARSCERLIDFAADGLGSWKA